MKTFSSPFFMLHAIFKKNTVQMLIICSLFFVLLLLSQLSYGANTATLKVSLTVIAPPACIINDNNNIEINFGDVMTTNIDGVNYRMPLDYSLSCDESSRNAMQLIVSGVGAKFDDSVLETSNPGLGIIIQNETSKANINQWIKFDYPKKPALWVVPVKDPSIELEPGLFTATATIKVAYQ